MSDTIDYVGYVHGLVRRYRDMDACHTESLAPYLGADGDADPRRYADYDETRATNALQAAEFLAELVGELVALCGEPVPGEAFTLTFAGLERHDGEKPYGFVVCARDLDDARRTLTGLPSFREWFEGQRPLGAPDGQAPDVLFVADESHPGIPAWGAYSDLRREQAAAASASAVNAAAPLSLSA
ncbi:hypothetical protein [Streptomyces tirandamycinicus]|uniref:Uncharacterized protein n=1 Tax=Streptomyces tirandamycinicus TaxID=2174846 RepID=A0A2S1T1T5_9ACTN|nr:hypothetical protein [Streptomyces tirandamycinicus]AWI32635.1 hypothetical protein DDW44_30415 [Streptomyces tirandamycinicus]